MDRFPAVRDITEIVHFQWQQNIRKINCALTSTCATASPCGIYLHAYQRLCISKTVSVRIQQTQWAATPTNWESRTHAEPDNRRTRSAPHEAGHTCYNIRERQQNIRKINCALTLTCAIDSPCGKNLDANRRSCILLSKKVSVIRKLICCKCLNVNALPL